MSRIYLLSDDLAFMPAYADTFYRFPLNFNNSCLSSKKSSCYCYLRKKNRNLISELM